MRDQKNLTWILKVWDFVIKFTNAWFKLLGYLAICSLLMFVAASTKIQLSRIVLLFSTLLLLLYVEVSIKKEIDPWIPKFFGKYWKWMTPLRFSLIYVVFFLALNVLIGNMLIEIMYNMVQQWIWPLG